MAAERGFDKLSADLGRSRQSDGSDGFQIVAGELRLNGKRVKAANLAAWQQSGWQQAMQDGKKSTVKDAHAKQPDEAVLCILAELADDHWANTEQLADPIRVFFGRQVDVDAVFEAGWEWGLLAKRRAEGKNWYQLPPSPPHIAPHEYLTANDRHGSVTADLKAIPFDALEQVVAISNQQASPARNSALLLTPDLPKLGRADDTLLATEVVQWLVEHTEPFAEAYVKLSERRGKTILHENVYIARVSDLSLKVAIEKALGSNLVSLKNDFVAFPRGLLDKVRRVVTKSGHVVKEVAADGH